MLYFMLHNEFLPPLILLHRFLGHQACRRKPSRSLPCGTVQRTKHPAKSRETHGVAGGGAAGGHGADAGSRGFSDSLQSFVLQISSNANSTFCFVYTQNRHSFRAIGETLSQLF